MPKLKDQGPESAAKPVGARCSDIHGCCEGPKMDPSGVMLKNAQKMEQIPMGNMIFGDFLVIFGDFWVILSQEIRIDEETMGG